MNLPTLPTPDSKDAPFIVLAGIMTGIIVLVLTLSILNYFNIFSLSQRWPNWFSVLPHQPYKPIVVKQGPITSVKQPIVSKDKEASSEVAPKVNSDLFDKVKSYVKPNLLPSSLEATQTKDNKGKIVDPKRFGSSWNKEDIRLDTTVRYNDDLSIGDFELLLTIPRITVALTPQTTTENINKYLLNTSTQPVKCGEIKVSNSPALPTQVICESFSQQNNVKRGIGVITPTIDGKGSFVFSCEFYPGSPFYDWRSCNVLKSGTGV